MKRILNALNIALGEILNNKVRSLLSVFAVSIGVLVFLFVFSALNYAKNEKAKQLAVAGENVFDIDIGDTDNIRLDMKNIAEMEQKFPELKFIAPRNGVSYTDDVRLENEFYNSQIAGITPNQKEFDWVYTNLKGRFISWDDVNNRKKVAVFLRSPLKNKGHNSRSHGGYGLWGYHESKDWSDKQDPVGQTINIMGEVYTIVGSLDMPLYSDDNRVEKITPNLFIPITSYMNSFWGSGRYISHITAALYDEKLFPSVKKRLELYIRNQAKDKTKWSIDITTYKDKIANNLKTMEENIKLVSILGLIALISGGIGIMNVILATIFARIKEIGTRRALGASKGDIFMQFAAESVTLSLLGACLGLLLSHFLFDSIKEIIKLKTEFNLLAVALAFGMAVITGFIFSIYPALKAANMDPVEALKIE